MKKEPYTAIYGFSGRYGREWTTAREASRYAASCFDRFRSEEDALAELEEAYGKPADVYVEGNRIFVIWKPEDWDTLEEERRHQEAMTREAIEETAPIYI